ncbi:hypothetical protein [Demequina sp.]|uniref:hypothetical protein n=1 Tax=Demequina sp. TaxID=2050685 RepID=UPI0025C32325|nr:hypothetical protein [Demequina sp.]
MRRSPQRIRTTAAACAATVGLVIIPVASAHATAVDVEDGDWAGSLSYVGSVDFGGEDPFAPDYQGAGTLSFSKNGTSVTGNYRLTVFMTEPTSGVSARGMGSGEVGMSDGELTLTLASLRVQEDSLGMDFTFSPAELGNPVGQMVTRDVSCDLVSGTWNHEFTESVVAGGGTTSGPGGTWVAVRRADSGPSSDELSRRASDLAARGERVVASYNAGTLDGFALREFLDFAESVTGGTSRSCSEGRAALRHVAKFVIGDLLDAASADPASLSLTDLLAMISAGVRAGVFDGDADLRSAYESELLGRATDAFDAGDEATLNRTWWAAASAGWVDTQIQIQDYMEDL